MNYTTEYQDYPTANQKYKDTLFRIIFSKKEDLLDLYNAINGTEYDNVDDLEITTLDNALYMTFKNDIAFLLDCFMNLYEHQSSYNPNMPLRGLPYFSRIYEKYITNRNLDIYGSTLQKIPTPRYIVFYNGTKNEPDKTTLRLSDAFQQEGGCLECVVTVLNINYGKNKNLMEKCKRLEEYAIFIASVRKLMEQEISLKLAINKAIDECIQKGILKDILIEQRTEVLGVLLSTFNKELYEKNLKEDAYSQGISQGARKKMTELIQRKLSKGKSIETIADELEESPTAIKEMIENIKSDNEITP